MRTFDYIVGRIDSGFSRAAVVSIQVEWTPPGDERFGSVKPDGCLAFVGDATRPGANDSDFGGQISATLRADAAAGRIAYADGWDEEKLVRLLDLWDRWHLNDMRAGCEHQRALGWTYDEHPSEPCPVCGYRFGSAWLSEEVPPEVLADLSYLDSKETNR